MDDGPDRQQGRRPFDNRKSEARRQPRGDRRRPPIPRRATAVALDRVPATRSAVAAIRLLMLTGCRLSEIQTLRWEHVDLEAGEPRLPDTKTGGRAVPLAPSAVRLLESLPREDDNPWVIAGKKSGSHLTDLQHPWRRIRARAELDDVRIHDLRHTFASEAVMAGESLPTVGKILGHTQAQTTARYAHLADDPLQNASDRVASSLKRALDG